MQENLFVNNLPDHSVVQMELVLKLITNVRDHLELINLKFYKLPSDQPKPKNSDSLNLIHPMNNMVL